MINKEVKLITYGRGYAYNIQYHIVWCVKYRKRVLVDDIEETMKSIINEVANELNFDIVAMECMPDHIHILVSCTPQLYIPTMIKILKGNTARRLFMAHPELKNKLWDGHLWNPSYFVSTVSETTQRDIEGYINKQKTK